MKRILYPTRLQIETLVLWASHGSSALMGEERDAHGRDMTRVRHMRRLRELMVRMDLDPRFLTRFNQSAHIRTVALDRVVLAELMTVARVCGYIVPDRLTLHLEATRCTASTLDHRALHVLRLLSYGFTTRECADIVMIQRFSVYSAVERAKAELNCRSIPHLIGEAHRMRILPTYQERQSLIAGRGSSLPVGYQIVDVDDDQDGES